LYSLQVRSRHGGKQSGSAGRGAIAYVGIVVGVSPKDSGHEKRSSGADRGVGVGIAVDAFAKGSGHGGKRSGDASRGSSACVGIVVGGRATVTGFYVGLATSHVCP
jgi:hypothetical protein